MREFGLPERKLAIALLG